MKIILATLLLSIPAMADEYAQVQDHTVVQVLVASAEVIAAKNDGLTWVLTQYKVGPGWTCVTCDGTDFINPFTVVVDTGIAISTGTP